MLALSIHRFRYQRWTPLRMSPSGQRLGRASRNNWGNQAIALLTLPIREPENGRCLVMLSRLEHSRRELRLIRRIREMLRFQAETIAVVIDFAIFPGNASVQEISAVELNAGFIRQHLQDASRLRIVRLGCQR